MRAVIIFPWANTKSALDKAQAFRRRGDELTGFEYARGDLKILERWTSRKIHDIFFGVHTLNMQHR